MPALKKQNHNKLSQTRSKKPLVSIIIPTRNSAKTLKKCLDSIVKQTYKNIEIIIVDCHSQDKTKNIAKNYNTQFLLKGPERSSQKNYGAKQANGELLYFVDSDFILEPDAVAKCVNGCTKFDAVTTINYSVGTTIWGKSIALKEHFLAHDPTIQNVRFIKRKLFLQVGGFDKKLIIGEDLDLYARLLKLRHKIGNVDAIEWHVGEPETLRDIAKRNYYYGKAVQSYFKKRKRNGIQQLSPFKPNISWMLIKTGSPYLFSLIIVDATRWLASLLGITCSLLK